jgi:hypothetical protein
MLTRRYYTSKAQQLRTRDKAVHLALGQQLRRRKYTSPFHSLSRDTPVEHRSTPVSSSCPVDLNKWFIAIWGPLLRDYMGPWVVSCYHVVNVTIDEVWNDNRICWTRIENNCSTHKLFSVFSSRCLVAVFKRRTFVFIWYPEPSPFSAASFSQL